jgi:hypothetical protein
MLTALLIFIIGLTPSLFSVWVIRQTDARTQTRLRLAVDSLMIRRLPDLHLSPDHHYVDGIGYMIGDLTCTFNARSSYIRCAVNPSGPCQECYFYQPRD